jgi:hypothetical protein
MLQMTVGMEISCGHRGRPASPLFVRLDGKQKNNEDPSAHL